MSKLHMKISGGTSRFAVEQPYFLKHMPFNPYLGAVHDGVSTGYMKGFSVKPIHWLYRFRYNVLPRGIPTGFFNRNPYGKNVHWLEVSNWEKFRLALVNDEAACPVWLSIAVLAVTTWHLWRVFIYHPDMTMYNIAMWSSKPWVEQFRSNKKVTFDQPVFRWFQRCPEFYSYDAYRDLIKLGAIANDPWIDYCKSIGRADELVLHPHERSPGDNGRGKIIPGCFDKKAPAGSVLEAKRNWQEKFDHELHEAQHQAAGHGDGHH